MKGSAHRDVAARIAVVLATAMMLCSEDVTAQQAPTAPVDEVSAKLRTARELFNKGQEVRNKRQESVKLLEKAAKIFVEAVDAMPAHPDAASALENAALAYEELRRFESASSIWRRIVDEHPESELADMARFRLAYGAYRLLELDEAVTHFMILARHSKSRDVRQDSIVNAATILTNLQRYEEAAPFWQQYADPTIVHERWSRSEAAFRAAEMIYKAGNWNGAIDELRSFVTTYRASTEAGPYRVRAAYLIAEAQKNQQSRSEYFEALEDVVNEFVNSGERPGSRSAEYAAEARFRLVDRSITDLARLRIGERAKQSKQQIDDGQRRLSQLEKSYGTVFAYRSLEWAVAASCQIGVAHEHLANAIRDSAPSSDLLAKSSELLQRSLSLYAKCTQLAREGNIVSAYSRHAAERLHALAPEEYPAPIEGITAMEIRDVAMTKIAVP